MSISRKKVPAAVAASLHLDRPGTWNKRGRKNIAKWLRDRANDLEKFGEQMNDNGRFRARYFYAK